MRIFTLALIICIAAAIGVVVGVTLVRPSGTSLALATQQREDQIMVSGGEGELSRTWVYIPFGHGNSRTMPAAVPIDPSKYPPGTTFRLWWAVLMYDEGMACGRLVDLGEKSAVPGSDTCVTNIGPRFGESEPFTLPSGRRHYTVQGKEDRAHPSVGGLNTAVFSWRVIAEWEEPVQVTALPDTGFDAPSGWALPYGASVAAGALMVGIGGLYVVRMRRQA